MKTFTLSQFPSIAQKLLMKAQIITTYIVKAQNLHLYFFLITLIFVITLVLIDIFLYRFNINLIYFRQFYEKENLLTTLALQL